MTRAACTYGGGWFGIVVADGNAPPLALCLTRSLELGHLEDRDAPAVSHERTWDKRRVVAPEDVATLATETMALLSEHGVEAITFGLPHGPVAAHLQQIGTAIEASGVSVTYADAPEIRGMGRRALPAILAALPGWPSGQGPAAGDADVCRRAAALLLLQAAVPAVVESNAPHVPTSAPLTMQGTLLPERDGVLDVPADQSVIGTRWGGVDPGTAAVGVVVTAGDAPPLRAIVVRSIEVGRMVPLPKPKIMRLADGSERVTLEKRDVGAADIAKVAAQVVQVFRVHGVTDVVIEWTPHLHSLDASAGAKARSGHVTRTQFIGGAIFGALLVEGFRVTLVLAATWRAKVAGRRGAGGGAGAKGVRVGAGRAALGPAVAAGYVNWPAFSDVHERDAGGCILYEVTKPIARAPAPPRRPRDHEEKREKAVARSATLRKRTAERREAAGCECGGKRHRRICPGSKPLIQWGWAESAMLEPEWTATLPIRNEAMRAYGDNLAWCSLSPDRRDAITRARTLLPEFDVRSEFTLCQVCRKPCADAGGWLPASPITCQCPASSSRAAQAISVVAGRPYPGVG